MIVRIMHEGQYRVDEAGAKALESFDNELYSALQAGDEARFAAVLSQAIDAVHHHGYPLDSDALVPSELTIPDPGATLEEVRELLASDESQEA